MIKHGKCIQNGLFNKKVKITYYKRKYMLLLLLYKSYIIYVMMLCVYFRFGFFGISIAHTFFNMLRKYIGSISIIPLNVK